MILAQDFYLENNVLEVAKKLIGKTLYTNIDNHITSGIIFETEAYNGIKDKASHAYNNRYTKRTKVMYLKGGCSYIYLCYGIHSLFNVVTNLEGIPHAVLIRGIIPKSGFKIIKKRTGKLLNVLKGPGILSKAMGIHYTMSGTPFNKSNIWIEDQGRVINRSNITITPRIGVDYAGKDALLPYRFVWDFVKDEGSDL